MDVEEKKPQPRDTREALIQISDKLEKLCGILLMVTTQVAKEQRVELEKELSKKPKRTKRGRNQTEADISSETNFCAGKDITEGRGG